MAEPPRSRRSAEPGAATRRWLVRTAERLFARHGIDAVSLNEIVHAAGANAAAIHYHFGGREGLLEAILLARHPAWSERAYAMVDELERRDDVTARDVVAAMVEPIATLRSHSWGADYLRFLADIAGHRRYAPILHRVAEEHQPRYLKQVERVTPALPDHVRVARYAYVRAFAFHAMAASDQRVAMWLTSVGTSPTSWSTDDLIDLLTGALVAPVNIG